MYKSILSLGLILGLVFSNLAAAADAVPTCQAYGRDLPVNNQQVLHWKRTTPNQFRERANVTGTVVTIYPDRNGHEHFSIQIGKRAGETLEVIYNQDFGAMPTPAVGATVQACGDYITSTAKSGPYPASPEGAIIHWVHANPSGRGHDSGFVMIDGKLYGQDAENAGPRPYPQPREKNKKKPRGH